MVRKAVWLVLLSCSAVILSWRVAGAADETTKFRILLTNDDGIQLAKVLLYGNRLPYRRLCVLCHCFHLRTAGAAGLAQERQSRRGLGLSLHYKGWEEGRDTAQGTPPESSSFRRG